MKSAVHRFTFGARDPPQFFQPWEAFLLRELLALGG
jgi:hypothetical protein